MHNKDDFESYLNFGPTVFFRWKATEERPILYVTENVAEILGYTQEDFLSGKVSYTSLIHKDDVFEMMQDVETFSKSNRESFKHKPYRVIAKNKEIIWLDDYIKVIRDKEGKPLHFFGYIKNITDFKTINQDLEAYQTILNTTAMITVSDTQGNIIYANQRFLENSGYTLKEILNKPHNILRHPDTEKEVFFNMWRTIKENKIWKGMIKSRRKNGADFYADVTIIPFLDSLGNIEKYIGVRHDVTPLIMATNAIKEQSQKDNLTGIGNRFKLLRDLHKAENPSLAIFDISHFGEINDFYGYKIGDKVLVALSQELRSLIDEKYELYRINADEFACLANGIPDEEFASYIKRVHEECSKKTFFIEDKEIHATLVVGLSCENQADLMATADLAKNNAKNKHSLYCLYTPEIELSKEYERNIFWASRIKKALKEDKIVPFYQPIFNNTTKRIEKYEALVRIVDDTEVISPFYFLEIAKRSHQYLNITKRMIDKTFATFGDNTFTLSLNLTIEDIISQEIREYLWHSTHAHNMQNRLVLEIVESEGIKDFKAIESFLEKAKKCGCELAIDDFGTGYSNFEYLIKLQADYIKIDGSIIQNINDNAGTLDVIKAIVSFAKARNMATIAEFVSSKEIFDAVCALGIDYSQGYYIGEPKPSIS